MHIICQTCRRQMTEKHQLRAADKGCIHTIDRITSYHFTQKIEKIEFF